MAKMHPYFKGQQPQKFKHSGKIRKVRVENIVLIQCEPWIQELETVCIDKPLVKF